MRTCAHDGVELTGRIDQVFCGDACRMRAARRRAAGLPANAYSEAARADLTKEALRDELNALLEKVRRKTRVE